MHGFGYAAALVLAAVFARAGGAKLRTRAATETTFVALGLPRTAAVAVPVAELALAIALVLAPGWGAAFALALLAGFTTFLTRAVRAGVGVRCNCFGSARRAPVSWVELLRNGWLAAAGVVALSASRPTAPHAGAVVVITGAVVVALVSLRAADERRRSQDEGPPVGEPAPPVPGVQWDRNDVTVVAFLAPSCRGCAEARTLLADVARQSTTGVQVLDLHDANRPVFSAYRIKATPYYVVVDAAGIVRSRGPDAKVLQSAK
jgi:hypothetical protein